MTANCLSASPQSENTLSEDIVIAAINTVVRTDKRSSHSLHNFFITKTMITKSDGIDALIQKSRPVPILINGKRNNDTTAV